MLSRVGLLCFLGDSKEIDGRRQGRKYFLYPLNLAAALLPASLPNEKMLQR